MAAQFDHGFAEVVVRTAVKSSVAGHDVDVSIRICHRSHAAGPNRCLAAIWGIVERVKLRKSGGIETYHKAMITSAVALRAIGNINYVAQLEQTRTLMLRGAKTSNATNG